MLELLIGGLIIGVVVGAPIGPIGTASLVQIMSGDYRSALTGMAGCFVAETVLVLAAVLATAELKAYLTDLPQFVYFGVSLVLLAIGSYFLFAKHMLQLGYVATFLMAFKVTLLSPNNLLALMALISAMGFATQLNSLMHNLAFMFSELLGVVLSWAAVLWMGWRMRGHRRVEMAIPWLRRGVGTFMVITAIIIVMRRI